MTENETALRKALQDLCVCVAGMTGQQISFERLETAYVQALVVLNKTLPKEPEK